MTPADHAALIRELERVITQMRADAFAHEQERRSYARIAATTQVGEHATLARVHEYWAEKLSTLLQSAGDRPFAPQTETGWQPKPDECVICDAPLRDGAIVRDEVDNFGICVECVKRQAAFFGLEPSRSTAPQTGEGTLTLKFSSEAERAENSARSALGMQSSEGGDEGAAP